LGLFFRGAVADGQMPIGVVPADFQIDINYCGNRLLQGADLIKGFHLAVLDGENGLDLQHTANQTRCPANSAAFMEILQRIHYEIHFFARSHFAEFGFEHFNFRAFLSPTLCLQDERSQAAGDRSGVQNVDPVALEFLRGN